MAPRSLGALLPLLLAGCATLLGIEEVTCDPEFDSECDEDADGGADDDGADDDGAGADDDEGAREPETLDELCEQYCPIVTERCTEANGGQQFESEAACQVVCAKGLVLGEPGDGAERDDTAFCRLENARTAGAFGELESECAAAGLGADGACGPICEVYCNVLATACSEEPAVDEVPIVHDFAACLTECEGLPRTPEPFDFQVMSGNTLECRLWHVQAAFGRTDLHCPHATGQAPCAD